MRYNLPWMFTAIGIFTASLPSVASAACTDTWFYGVWRSNANASVENFAFQGKVAEGRFKERLRDDVFGKMIHVIDEQKFAVLQEVSAGNSHRVEAGYQVIGCTANTVTLRFTRSDWPDLTLYAKHGCYMVRTGSNFEHFCLEVK
jgi:hypothetical protein